MDGLLADTDRLHRQAYQDAFGELGISLSDDDYNGHWVRRGGETRSYIESKGLGTILEPIRELKAQFYWNLIKTEVQPMDGSLEFLASVHGSWPLAVATSSYRRDAMAVLGALEVVDLFAAIITKDDVSEPKPAPEAFLRAAQALKVDPNYCIVFEDAEKGIVAADKAGMRSVAVPNDMTLDNDFSKAFLVVSSFKELNRDRLVVEFE